METPRYESADRRPISRRLRITRTTLYHIIFIGSGWAQSLCSRCTRGGKLCIRLIIICVESLSGPGGPFHSTRAALPETVRAAPGRPVKIANSSSSRLHHLWRGVLWCVSTKRVDDRSGRLEKFVVDIPFVELFVDRCWAKAI